jgi:TPR repeat protein
LAEIPDVPIPEGICLNVLTTAAKHRNPRLATIVYKALAEMDIKYDVQHFLPLIDAYSRADDLRQAFIVMKIMRESSLTPPRISFFRSLINTIASSSTTLDKAFFHLQDLIHKEGKQIDILAMNVVLAACVQANDTTRAIACYRDIPSLHLIPDLTTFNLMLHVAQKLAHVELAMHVLGDLKAANVTPDRETYSRVILTYVGHDGENYDDGFIYLEDMISRGFTPSYNVLLYFLRKCVYHRDSRAQGLALEMKRLGYDDTAAKEYMRRAARYGHQDIILQKRQLAIERRNMAERQAEDVFRDIHRIDAENEL